MSLRLLPLLLLACLSSNAIAAQAGADSTISRIDHILIEQKATDDSFQLFANQLQVPVIWPMVKYGPFSSGGLYFGNVVLEFGQFAALGGVAPESPRLAGIAFQPLKSAAASMLEFDQHQIAHGPAEPFTTYRDGKPQALWTNVRISGIGPADSWLFVCEYHFDSKLRQTAAFDELQKLKGGPLGLLGVKEVIIETPDLQAARARWKNLLSSAIEQEAGVFTLSSGPVIRLAQGKSEALRSLTIEVSSLSQTRAALAAQSIAYDDKGTEILLGNGNVHGLPFRLVQRD
ncbi:hypothetical protein ACO0LC_18660 [Undibacterium sp. JH2W]|uniref:hypothetical protein n=1 Tax=Undibacterium sp. JH2W TaxID=3413037 RepID=UPI003BF2974C